MLINQTTLSSNQTSDKVMGNANQVVSNKNPPIQRRSSIPPSIGDSKNAAVPPIRQNQQQKAAIPSAFCQSVPSDKVPIQAKSIGDWIVEVWDTYQSVEDLKNAMGDAAISTLFDHSDHVDIANEFGTTFGKVGFPDEKNITPEQAAVLASHIYNCTEDNIGKGVNVDEDLFGGLKDDMTPNVFEETPYEITQVEGMENFVLEEIFYNYEEGTGDLKMGVYSQVVDDKKEYYLVNMGTTLYSPDSWTENFKNIDGYSIDTRDSIRHAVEFKDSLPTGTNVTMIGHSKGGGEAAANAVKTDSDAILLNPNTPFLSKYMSQDEIQNYHGDMNMYVAEGEALHTGLSLAGYRGVSDENINFVLPKYDNMLYDHGLESIIYGLTHEII